MVDLAGMEDGTPERFVPELMTAGLIAIDHHARYWWVSQLASGRRVLDAACGVAYGSAILRDAGASAVTGIDRAGDVLAAVAEQVGDGVQLQQATLEELPFEDGSFDLVVCFEAIEHVEDTEHVLDELTRVCEPDAGILAVSSPNREVYIGNNPHHVREFLPAELRETLERRFAHVRLLAQQDWLVSGILDAEAVDAHGSGLDGVDVRTLAGIADAPEQFVVALASNAPLPASDGLLVLGDPLESRLRRLRKENARLRERLARAERPASLARRLRQRVSGIAKKRTE